MEGGGVGRLSWGRLDSAERLHAWGSSLQMGASLCTLLGVVVS